VRDVLRRVPAGRPLGGSCCGPVSPVPLRSVHRRWVRARRGRKKFREPARCASRSRSEWPPVTVTRPCGALDPAAGAKQMAEDPHIVEDGRPGAERA
jgi:hypothetical protein